MSWSWVLPHLRKEKSNYNAQKTSDGLLRRDKEAEKRIEQNSRITKYNGEKQLTWYRIQNIGYNDA